MNRFTYELGHKGSKQYDTNNTNDMPINNIWKAINKLGQLEDIEEKHNIDLLNALSILDNGIWIFYEEGKIINVKPTLKLIDNSYWFEYDYFIYKPNDYGRTWALTKEELEK